MKEKGANRTNLNMEHKGFLRFEKAGGGRAGFKLGRSK